MNVTSWLFSALALASLATLAARRPWTLRIARRQHPPEVWSTPLFLETNMVITAAWTALFAFGAVLAALAPWWVSFGYGALLSLAGRLSPHAGTWYARWRLA